MTAVLATAAAPDSTLMDCPVCGGGDFVPYLLDISDYLTGDRFDIDRCTGCGLLLTRPMPTDAQIDRYYPPAYRGNRHGFTARLRVVLRRRQVERRFAPGFRGTLLDVGCGDGAFVLEMHRRGWRVCATELDAATVQRLRGEGIEAQHPADAERTGFSCQGQSFDAVTCWHVLEHVLQPADVARWVSTQLRPGGLFFATVPNAGSLQARLFGRNWLHFDTPRHRYHFTPRTFARLLQNASFAIAGRSAVAFEYDWFGVIQSTLNLLCSHRNVLFDKLTGAAPHEAPGSHAAGSGLLDALLSYTLAIPLAMVSLPLLLLDWACGDGSSLTLVCRREGKEKDD